jgi:hypothetical protein
MIVIQPVVDVPTILSMSDKTGDPQQLQLLADGGLLHRKRLCDPMHGQLSLFEEKQDLQASRITENLEEIGNIRNFLIQWDRTGIFFHIYSGMVRIYHIIVLHAMIVQLFSFHKLSGTMDATHIRQEAQNEAS